MSVSSQLKSRATRYRPTGASVSEITCLVKLAADWLDRLEPALRSIKSNAFLLTKDQRLELALAMTEMAEDLHADSGLWRSLESCNRALFRTPLPGLWRPDDPPLDPLDARRFQFFLDGVWRHFQPDFVVSPRHPGFAALATEAAAFFAARLVAAQASDSVAVFLDAEHPKGWDVKRKLIWLGTGSFLLRLAHADYLAHKSAENPDLEPVVLTDDFLCQACTSWSGLGALELLSERLGLRGTERTELLGWHARHTAFYRVESLAVQREVLLTMDLQNLVNGQPYRVRIEMPRVRIPFQVGEMIFGGLVPWRGEWYWSGAQRRCGPVPDDVSELRRNFFRHSSFIAYRYCAERAAKARRILEEHHAGFVRFHGSDLAVFPDGLVMAASEQRRLRPYTRLRATELKPAETESSLDQELQEKGPDLPYGRDILDCRRGVAVFSQPGESNEIMREFDLLVRALQTEESPIPQEQAEVLQGFIESPAASPAFARRVFGLHGWRGLASFYGLLSGDETALEHLLRRHKGAFYRPRPPDITLVDD